MTERYDEQLSDEALYYLYVVEAGNLKRHGITPATLKIWSTQLARNELPDGYDSIEEFNEFFANLDSDNSQIQESE